MKLLTVPVCSDNWAWWRKPRQVLSLDSSRFLIVGRKDDSFVCFLGSASFPRLLKKMRVRPSLNIITCWLEQPLVISRVEISTKYFLIYSFF